MDGVSKANINTLGGKTAENRGRRGFYPPGFNPDSPFEDGQLSDNWAKRGGQDEIYSTHQDKRTDKSIYTDVCEKLLATPYVDATDIEVAVKAGVVELKGMVEDRKMKKMAELVLDSISGIKDIQNDLTLQRRDYEER
jgi:hypothetical protein